MSTEGNTKMHAGPFAHPLANRPNDDLMIGQAFRERLKK